MKRFFKHLLWKYVTQNPQYEENQVPCDKVVLEEIDSELYGKLLAQAEQAGAQFAGNRVTLKGCEFYWSYDAESKTLTYQCMTKPFYFPCGTIDAQIKGLIEKAKAGL